MKRLLLIVMAAALIACANEPQKPKIEHVVVIGVDGLTVRGVEDAATPIFDSLMNVGAHNFSMRVVMPSVSTPNWASMINGATTEMSGITSNEWEIDDYQLEPVVKGVDNIFPTMFAVIGENYPNAKQAIIYQWSGFGRLVEKSKLIHDIDCKDDPYLTAKEAARVIETDKPTLTFIQIDQVDHAGHGQIYDSPDYMKTVTFADSLAGVIIEAVKKAGIADKTLIVVQSDHGGNDDGHGGITPSETTIPFIVAGPGVKKNFTIKDQMYVIDVAPTIVWALGLEQPYYWVGRPMKFAFEGNPDMAKEVVKLKK